MEKQVIARWGDLEDRVPAAALIENVDLVVIRYGERVSVFYGRCLHRGALLADGHVDGQNLICGVHDWDYRLQSGVSEYNNDERLPKFNAWVEDGDVLIDRDEIRGNARTRSRTTGTSTKGRMPITPALPTSRTPA